MDSSKLEDFQGVKWFIVDNSRKIWYEIKFE